jgi:glycosyltransferase involved in cell wall biosynthesis
LERIYIQPTGPVAKYMNIDSSPLVSVITPVYNGAKYLAECIESVLRQTYPHFEYVIVNNHSKDTTLEIAESYARKDPRIRVHNNTEFLPVIQNWNRALRQISAQSRYCKVVHADDWLFPECLQKMVQLAEENPSVAIVGAYALRGDKVWLDGLPFPSTVVSGRELCRGTLTRWEHYVFGSPTSILMRADDVRKRPQFYNELNFHADWEVCYELLKDKDFGFIHQVLTYTRQHAESGTAFATRYLTLRPGAVAIFVRYGRYYLSEEEYQFYLQNRLRAYYHDLAKGFFEFRGTAFWRYHGQELQKIGYRISLFRLAAACSGLAFNLLINPGILIKTVLRRLQRRKEQSP